MNQINYHNRKFRGRTNSPNGEVSGQTTFTYYQEGSTLFGTYSGGTIDRGDLLGTVNPDSSLTFVYHHKSLDGTLHAGQCNSIPTYDEKGRLVLQESWQWFTGDGSTGYSEVEEI
jgi:hypothetical protein